MTGRQPRDLSRHQARRLRVLAQGLGARPHRSVVQVVTAAAGLQAQQWSAAVLSVRARSTGLRATDVEDARERDRSVVRGWFMRGTLHLVPAEDFGGLLDLYAPVITARSERRYRQLGLDAATRDRGVAAIRAAVTDRGPLTRAELVDELLSRGVRIDPRSQAVPHLIAAACLRGIVCHGPHRDGEPAFALLDRWLPERRRLDPEDALDELARRYLAAFGPATLADFVTWSGLPRGQLRFTWNRIGGELTEVRVEGTRAWMLTATATRTATLEEAGRTRLLPAFDTYLLGYESREAIIAPEHARRVWPGGGILRPTVLVDGRAVATWRYDTARRTPVVRVEPFSPLDAATSTDLQAETADVGRFLGTAPTLAVS